MSNNQTVETDKAWVLSQVCERLSEGAHADASGLLGERYPFVAREPASRGFTPAKCVEIFRRDGFVDQYSGNRLIYPGVLRLISRVLPDDFPFHKNWKSNACHFAYYELFPTIDHLVPISRGGTNDETNLVTTSMLRNSAKANFTLEELGWARIETTDLNRWDGLVRWFIEFVEREPTYLTADRYLQQWYKAAKGKL